LALRAVHKGDGSQLSADYWPAKKIVETDGTLRFVLKNGAEIQRLDPPPEILEYKASSDWEQPF
jgi:hypothetical protein